MEFGYKMYQSLYVLVLVTIVSMSAGPASAYIGRAQGLAQLEV